ncbi:PepSY domain-containing protein [[Pseudomonas] carboxydohydrogena]|uniref:PepSY domain-containing protein n=1 Tax=Afipia carboxydohydrogena TaxID=290 RepID=A0ABY8BT17_AFICR|nr:PepSY-associated TM helix domain-containing protein [[Pseudomonas] carboxydohydrogena]WEF51795.1 PepSY domain-containing protein [[Pseudomonas] carboxydohydrogena]
MSKSSTKAVLLEVHSIAGLALSLLLALVALTGATMSFEDEIQAALNAGMTRVEARAEPKLMPGELIARVQQTFGANKISSLTITGNTTSAVRIRFAPDERRVRPSSVYVDPYDARVIGTPVGEGFFITVRKLHRWLLIPGDAKGYGRPITGIGAIGLILMLLSGLVLRWPRRARSIGAWLKPGFALRGRGLHRSLHAVFGTWVLLIYLVIALTGLWYSFDWYRQGAVWLLSHPSSSTTAKAVRSPEPPEKSGGKFVISSSDLDRVWAAFLEKQTQGFAIAQMTLPTGSSKIVRIRSWPYDGSSGERDEFRVNAATAKIVSSELYAEKGFGDRILARVLDIHRGSILGWPGKLLFMLAALMMPLFVVTGLLLYLSRRRHKQLSRVVRDDPIQIGRRENWANDSKF